MGIGNGEVEAAGRKKGGQCGAWHIGDAWHISGDIMD